MMKIYLILLSVLATTNTYAATSGCNASAGCVVSHGACLCRTAGAPDFDAKTRMALVDCTCPNGSTYQAQSCDSKTFCKDSAALHTIGKKK